MFGLSILAFLAMGPLGALDGGAPPSVPAPQTASPGPMDPPRLKIEPSGKLNLGSLGPRERRLQRYRFTNMSGAPIALRVFDLSPGVTVEGAALAGPIAAHATAELVLGMDPEGWVGHQSRNVRLGTDDPRQGTYYLPFEMEVRPDLSVDRERVDFGDVAVPGSPQMVFTFTRETGEPVVLRMDQTLPPYLEMEKRESRHSVELAFTLRTERVPPGVRLGFERISVETAAPLQPHFDLYLAWKLHHAVDASPSRLVFLDWGRPSLTLSLRSHSGKPFRVLKAEVEGEGFRVGPLGEGQEVTLHRTALVAARAMLVLWFQGEDVPLKVPLSFLPTKGRPGRSS
jgi:hypothetical protein